MSEARADIGLIGLGTMGQNLVLNMADHGYHVAVYNRTTSVTDEFIAANPDTPGGLTACRTLGEFVAALRPPRIAVLLVPAGKAVDAVTGQLIDAGVARDDLIVDAGNSLWTDTIRREREYADRLKFFGSGVSGGSEGARFGPSLMAGGDAKSWQRLKPIWEAIAAKINAKTGRPIEGAAPGKPVKGGQACAAHIGPDGAGHYVKMVHNGIEYADMQLIGEAYWLLSTLLELEPPAIGDIFARWNKGDLDSYLVEITADILHQKDPGKRGRFLVDSILDAAGQKGTGKWTSVNALDMGVAAPTMTEAVFARIISAIKDERVAAAKKLKGPAALSKRTLGPREELVDAIRQALYCSKICAYAQGFQLMREAQKEYHWTLDFATIARIWRGGCIIRARFLQRIAAAYEEQSDLPNLLLDGAFRRQINAGQEAWRRVVSLAALAGVPCPAFMSALAYYDSYRSSRLPANLLQAQRDYFGSHTYERIDQPRGAFFHLDWSHPDRPENRA